MRISSSLFRNPVDENCWLNRTINKLPPLSGLLFPLKESFVYVLTYKILLSVLFFFIVAEVYFIFMHI